MTTPSWAQQADRLEMQASLLRQLGTVLEQDPSFKLLVLQLLGDLGSPRSTQAAGQQIRTEKRVTLWEQVSKFFEENGNEWATVPEIAEATGNKSNSVAHQFYKSHKDEVVKRDHPAGGKMKQFKLRESDV
ncbi:hypothetical protein AY599_00365 [Leptolyngbya valderiana BDU 20041]|nr:hypothetical protein AY599_00365 [Leptolyngbya valderiana BDU 20041]